MKRSTVTWKLMKTCSFSHYFWAFLKMWKLNYMWFPPHHTTPTKVMDRKIKRKNSSKDIVLSCNSYKLMTNHLSLWHVFTHSECVHGGLVFKYLFCGFCHFNQHPAISNVLSGTSHNAAEICHSNFKLSHFSRFFLCNVEIILNNLQAPFFTGKFFMHLHLHLMNVPFIYASRWRTKLWHEIFIAHINIWTNAN